MSIMPALSASSSPSANVVFSTSDNSDLESAREGGTSKEGCEGGAGMYDEDEGTHDEDEGTYDEVEGVTGVE